MHLIITESKRAALQPPIVLVTLVFLRQNENIILSLLYLVIIDLLHNMYDDTVPIYQLILMHLSYQARPSVSFLQPKLLTIVLMLERMCRPIVVAMH